MAGELQLEQRQPLDGWADALATASSHALRIQVIPGCGVVNLRGGAPDQGLVTDVQRLFGLELPLEPNRWHGDECFAAIWLGPDEWLLVVGDEEAGRIEEMLREARPMDPWLSVVDVSHSWTRISLAGPGVRDLLAKGCALDLHPEVFPAGHCAQTILAKSRVLLRAVDRSSFEAWVRNSFACYAAKWLLDACAQLPVRESLLSD